MKDYYAILEVQPGASPEAIKKAYFNLAKKYHPDTTTFDKAFAQQRMAEINNAYDILSNPNKRQAYVNGFNTNIVYASADNIAAYKLADELLLGKCQTMLKQLKEQNIVSLSLLWQEFNQDTSYTYTRLKELHLLGITTDKYYLEALNLFLQKALASQDYLIAQEIANILRTSTTY